VVDPLTRQGERGNVGEKTPYIHCAVDPAVDGVEIAVLPKGGSENMSAFTVLPPWQEAKAREAIKRFVHETAVEAAGKPCPPTIIGVGLGCSTDLAMALAKLALLRPVGARHKEERLARFEAALLEAVNQTDIGPMGWAGRPPRSRCISRSRARTSRASRLR
jgi:fumarate hydratase subunit alpha